MHEVSLSKNILNMVKQKVSETHCSEVKKIYLEIGQLAAIERSLLSFIFDVLSQGTIAENACLEIVEVPAKAQCEKCQRVVFIDFHDEQCQFCDHNSLKIIQGEELSFRSIEIIQ